MHHADVARERLFTMRMSEEEHARLETVAKHYALNAAGLIRMLVKREDDRLRRELYSAAFDGSLPDPAAPRGAAARVLERIKPKPTKKSPKK